jgi:uncharacterized protein (DUF849 family)
MMLFQPPLPPHYSRLSQDEMAERVREHREAFADRLVILGHHYQQDDVIRFADYTGDSLKLAQLAAQQKQAEYIVFCGVHFMAETAAILAPDKIVLLPEIEAGARAMLERGIKPELEIFNPVLIEDVDTLIAKGLLKKPYYFGFVMGMRRINRAYMPYSPKLVMQLVEALPADSMFSVLGIGSDELPATTLSILLGCTPLGADSCAGRSTELACLRHNAGSSGGVGADKLVGDAVVVVGAGIPSFVRG